MEIGFANIAFPSYRMGYCLHLSRAAVREEVQPLLARENDEGQGVNLEGLYVMGW